MLKSLASRIPGGRTDTRLRPAMHFCAEFNYRSCPF